MPLRPLNIAALPLNIVWADRQANLDAVELAIANLRPGTDIVVLPELFTTAFVAEQELMRQLAEPDNGSTITQLRGLSERSKVAIAGSFLARNADGTEFYNRAFFIEPGGETHFCNKRHLFHLSPEAQMLTPGAQPYITARFRGWNVAVGVCYDLRFPVWCRNVMLHGSPAYDLFLFVANWPQARAFALQTLLSARAIENQAYTICANRSGQDDYGHYDGLSFCMDFYGRTVAQSAAAEPIYATLNHDDLAQARKKMPAYLDADSFTIKY